jgi:hypothetical protein
VTTDVDPDKQLEFVLGFVEELREQTGYTETSSQLGITERRYERALDAFASILTRRKGKLLDDEDGRDVMFALGFEVEPDDEKEDDDD